MKTSETIYGDVMVKASPEGPASDADNVAIERMQELAAAYHSSEHHGDRLRIHLVLRNQALADRLKRLPLSQEMSENVELYAYTAEDLWAMELLGIHPEGTTKLDRNAITPDSNQHIHLVIFGASNQAESLAIHTALTSHYPNYCRNNELRTRITMIVDSLESLHHFEQRYHSLLVNSYRRTVKLNGEQIECETLEPQYVGQRKDFVDVEWEFVEANCNDQALSYKLIKWAKDEHQQLTIAFCHDDCSRNVSEVLSLHRDVILATPVWLKVTNDTAMSFMKQSGQFEHIYPFGMNDAKISSLSAFIKLAQCVNYAYCSMRESSSEEQQQGLAPMRVALDIPSPQKLQELWNNPKLTTAKRWSNIYNAFTLRSKMHSLGIPVAMWGTLFTISDKDVETFSEVEHNRWSVEELILGYEPTTELEHKSVEQNIALRETFKAQFKHEDLRSYHELGIDDTGLPVARYDKGITRTLPLIAYTYHQMKEERHE